MNYLKKAIKLSKESVAQGGFPVGALVVKNDKIIACGISNGKNKKDATSHAEIEAIREASRVLNNRDLVGCEVYSSMEPCLMCFSAMYWAKIEKVTYAVSKEKLKKQHYEGLHSLKSINKRNNRQTEVIHDESLQNEAMLVIKSWEEKSKP